MTTASSGPAPAQTAPMPKRKRPAQRPPARLLEKAAAATGNTPARPGRLKEVLEEHPEWVVLLGPAPHLGAREPLYASGQLDAFEDEHDRFLDDVLLETGAVLDVRYAAAVSRVHAGRPPGVVEVDLTPPPEPPGTFTGLAYLPGSRPLALSASAAAGGPEEPYGIVPSDPDLPWLPTEPPGPEDGTAAGDG